MSIPSADLHLGQIGGKDRMELRGVDVQEPGLIGPERRAERGRILVAERADRLADLGRERRDIDERLHIGAPSRGGGDHRPPIRVPDQDH